MNNIMRADVNYINGSKLSYRERVRIVNSLYNKSNILAKCIDERSRRGKEQDLVKIEKQIPLMLKVNKFLNDTNSTLEITQEDLQMLGNRPYSNSEYTRMCITCNILKNFDISLNKFLLTLKTGIVANNKVLKLSEKGNSNLEEDVKYIRDKITYNKTDKDVFYVILYNLIYISMLKENISKSVIEVDNIYTGRQVLHSSGFNKEGKEEISGMIICNEEVVEERNNNNMFLNIYGLPCKVFSMTHSGPYIPCHDIKSTQLEENILYIYRYNEMMKNLYRLGEPLSKEDKFRHILKPQARLENIEYTDDKVKATLICYKKTKLVLEKPIEIKLLDLTKYTLDL